MTNKSDNVHQHMWGYADTYFAFHPDRTVELMGNRYSLCGNKMPELIPYIEKCLDVALDDPSNLQLHVQQVNVPSKSLCKSFYEAMCSTFDSSQYTVDKVQRLIHSHGQTSVDEIYRILYEQLSSLVDLVFYPYNEEDIKKIIQLAKLHSVCLIPYGGGTNVTNALTPPAQEQRTIVSVDMKYLNKIIEIDEKSMRAEVQAGIRGEELERKLQAHGYTVGHEPDSIEFSTLGGWIATNASGMKKNCYGNIEDIVEGFTLHTPKGEVQLLRPYPRQSMGMDISKMIFGCEGNLGIISKAIIKIHPKPAYKRYQSVLFKNLETGIKFLEAAQRKFQTLPASMRLMDNEQFKFGLALNPEVSSLKNFWTQIQKKILSLKGFDMDEVSLMILLFEGNKKKVKYEQQHIFQLAKQFGGLIIGSEKGKRGYDLTFSIAYIRDFFSRLHIIGETFETTVSWRDVLKLYGAVMAHAQKAHKKYQLPGKPFICARISQVYHSAVCVYFTYAFYSKGVSNPIETFSAIEHELREVILAYQGSISHHHGVGKLRQGFLDRVMSPTTMQIIKSFKTHIDPTNVFGVSNGGCY